MHGPVELGIVEIEKPDEVNVILGQAHFVKTVEDLYEAVAGSVPDARFGLAFSEASGDRLVRLEGTDDALKALARDTALALGAGHSFVIFLRDCYPINVLNAVKGVQEVCSVFCASANRVGVVVAEAGGARGILGVIDGEPPVGVEGEEDVALRTALLRRFGYKLPGGPGD
ncbi:MAG: adenosine monophosphate-protein transferase [Methanospirillum sp.]|nr:adenosine monophosphate-protein transferase [Methanospirillum sp.]